MPNKHQTKHPSQELAALCVEYLAECYANCPSHDERYGPRNKQVGRCPTQVLYATTQKEPCATVIYGLLSRGYRSIVDAPTVRIDKENIVWLGFTGRDGLAVRALLLDGKFTAVDREVFAPKRQTFGRYGRKVSEVADSLDSPLAEWLRCHLGRPKGILCRDAAESVMANSWSRACLHQAKLAFQAAADFYALDEEVRLIAATFLADGMNLGDAVLAAQSICI